MSSKSVPAGGHASRSGPASFAARPGAVGDPPLHYGNPLGEQKALEAGEAVVDLSDRAVITVTGPDRLTWLDSLTSQALTALQPGDSAETLLLDPTGRLEHAMRVIDDGVTTWLLVDGAEGEALAAWLDRMRFMLRVEVADRSADFATVGTLGLDVPAAAPNGVPLVWVDPWNEVVAGGHQYAASHPSAPWTYREALVPREADLGALSAAGTLALEALRIAAWRPRLATEVDEKSIPHELDWLRSAVHLSKGCYRGQETVAKVHNLGHPPRRLVMLHLDGSEGVVPGAGAEVLLPGSTDAHVASDSSLTPPPAVAPDSTLTPPPATPDTVVGRVTSSALHHELGPIALAVIKRNVDPALDLVVLADGVRVAAAQEVIVPTDAGAEANVPRLPRLGAVTRPHAS
ncbi:MAG: folate-binding protein [Rhodoglobus sp.]|nr:folate-binding protein [Rhodoglobus sp.]